MADDAEKELDKIVEAFDDITKNIYEAQKGSSGLIDSFKSITTSSTATGEAWVGIARFFSGTGFWRIQNKVKAVANVLRAHEKILDKRAKLENEQIRVLAEHEKLYSNIKKQFNLIDKIHTGMADKDEKQM